MEIVFLLYDDLGAYSQLFNWRILTRFFTFSTRSPYHERPHTVEIRCRCNTQYIARLVYGCHHTAKGLFVTYPIKCHTTLYELICRLIVIPVKFCNTRCIFGLHKVKCIPNAPVVRTFRRRQPVLLGALQHRDRQHTVRIVVFVVRSPLEFPRKRNIKVSLILIALQYRCRITCVLQRLVYIHLSPLLTAAGTGAGVRIIGNFLQNIHTVAEKARHSTVCHIQRLQYRLYTVAECIVLFNRLGGHILIVLLAEIRPARHDLVCHFSRFIIDKHTRIAQERLCSRQIIVRSLIALLEFFNLFHSSRLWFLPLCPHIHTQPQRHHQRQQQTDQFFHHTFLSFSAKRVRFSPLKR